MRNNRIIKPPLGTPLNRSHPLSLGLIGCWPMNEGGGQILFDCARNNNGTLANGAAFQMSQIGNCISFDGTNDIVTFTPGINPGTTFTISGWIFPISASDLDGALFSQGGTRGLFFGPTIFDYYQSGAHNNSTALVNDNWYHFAVVSNGSGIAWYRNGVADGTQSFSVIAPTLTHMGDDGVGDNFKGKIGSLYLYNRPLSASEVRQLYISPYSMFQNRRALKLAV